MDDAPISIEPDLAKGMLEHRRELLARLVDDEAWVRVLDPLHGTRWEGFITSVADYPTLTLQTSDGQTLTLPQHFAIDQIDRIQRPALPRRKAGPPPIAMTRERLVEVLEEARRRVAAGDCLEGAIEFLRPTSGSEKYFTVSGGFRLVDQQGRGEYHQIGAVQEDAGG